MAIHSQNILLLTLLVNILLVFPNGGAAASRKPEFLGIYEPIEHPEDAHIQTLAKFAVRRHIKNSGEMLVLTRVLSGQQQVVKGMNYRLVIGAEGDSGAEDLYLAVVYETAWNNYRELTAYDLIA
ncbi:unnamed protein product [Spirodela intermedia]|uniref:Cystatin domain-containing protein n=1 Tax=Spirodela intermedia TaxID=51605 RepID=A0A7I8KNC5_SPIIN|nr:unnamed protein product [Spirodela intermedia]